MVQRPSVLRFGKVASHLLTALRASAVFTSVTRGRRAALTGTQSDCFPALSKDAEDKAELCVTSTAWVLVLSLTPRSQQGTPSHSGVIGWASASKVSACCGVAVSFTVGVTAGGLTESACAGQRCFPSVFPASRCPPAATALPSRGPAVPPAAAQPSGALPEAEAAAPAAALWPRSRRRPGQGSVWEWLSPTGEAAFDRGIWEPAEGQRRCWWGRDAVWEAPLMPPSLSLQHPGHPGLL